MTHGGMGDKSAIPKSVLSLVERFDQFSGSYRSGQYNEAQLRHDFLDPFWEGLGWDVHNEKGFAEAYRDVVYEDALRIGHATKAPDYCFRIGGTRKFFLEAKKPSVSIKDDIGPAFQLRRYAWSAKLPLSVLSNFEELVVYDTRIRPVKDDPASTARIFCCTFREYAEKWDWIASVFSRDAVLKGSFDKFAEGIRAKRGTATVDDAFLDEIESWRKTLAQNLALRNAKLRQRELNFAVQCIIDRIIFLRICEDRNIEDYGRLLALVNGGDIYRRLCELFKEADAKYNSGLFHFKAEKGRHEPPDELTPSLHVDDKLLRDVLRNLYYPESPYEFSVLSIDILGQVYERFLGKTIRLTEGHRAVVEDKPEVKKAGGIYYTPTYIVNYIVKNTVGKLLEGKTPAQAAKLRILDPACGSGSFLIGAYQYLLDWHLDWYSANDPGKRTKGSKPVLLQAGGGGWKLTIAERKRILLNNIFGVDIDSQAVEVTKLSLLLKVLEGETEQTLQPLLRFLHERALPDLGDNIKCGNSLVSSDFYEGQQMSLLDGEERLHINVFDWQTEFSGIMTAGGFDIVIGNPPYIRIQSLQETNPEQVVYFNQHYRAAGSGNYDIYVVFVERGLSLLNQQGRLGFILPHKFFNSRYGEPLRGLISQGKHLAHIVHFGAQQIFEGATTYTTLLFLDKAGHNAFELVRVSDLQAWRSGHSQTRGKVRAEAATAAEWNFAVGKGAVLLEKLQAMPQRLGDAANVFVGLQTSADDVFIMNLEEETPRTLRLRSKALAAEIALEKQLLFPLVSGTDVNRYSPLPRRQYILFPYSVEGSVELIDFGFMSEHYPKTAEYLLANRKRLEGREKGRMKNSSWYGYIYLKNMTKQAIKKLCLPRLVKSLYATYDWDGSHFLDNVDVCGITWKSEFESHDLLYLLGLINSSLLRWYFPFVSAPFRGGWLSANRQFLSQVPVRIIEFSNSADKANHNSMVEMAKSILSLHTDKATAKTQAELIAVGRQIAAVDAQIDRLVYELYGLSEQEIKIVESAV